MRWHRLAAALLGVLVASALMGACLEELPPPAVCPAPAQVQGELCLSLFERTEVGCLTLMEDGPQALACFTGPRSNCDCRPDECTSGPDDCFPRDDCPPAVAALAGAETSCPKLRPEDFASPLTSPQSFQCVCGCLACAAVCDGKGPVIGVVDDAGPITYSPILIDVRSRLPDRGTLGLYLRARGYSSATVAVISGEIDPERPDAVRYVAAYLALTTPESFGELLFVGNNNLLNPEDPQPYRWTRAEDKPSYVLIQPARGAGDMLSHTLWEVDCLIPFVTQE